MKQIILMFLIAFLAIPALALAGVISPARVLLVDGDIMFRSPDADEWLPASVNTPLDEGDAIWAPDGSRTEIQLADGTVVRLDSGAQLDFIAIEEGFTHLHLASGRLYLRTAQSAGKNPLQVDADDTTILPDARTRLRVDMLPNSQEDVAIFKGSAYVEGNGARTKVRAGEHIALEDGHSELLPLNPPDSWEKWNSDRDRNQSSAAKAKSNLPDELQAFSGELEANGSWVSTLEYGVVWQPTVVISGDWAPYRKGRWIWKGNDYVWISYENWGWAPYHYGRWAVVGAFGWCWVPPVRGDIFWGPGYVGWYRTGIHVGWTPLAPGEIFYGHGHYGRHSVNIANASANTASVVYKNREAHGGFSIVLQNDFLKGRAVFQKPSDLRTVSVSVSLGSPRIQPIRETRMPIIRQTPPRAAQPVSQHHDIRELQVRFPRLAPQKDSPPSLNQPGRRVQTSLPGQTDKRSSQTVSTRKGESTGQGTRPVELKQKKVWRVITTEHGGDANQKEKESKEHKGKK